MKTNISINAIDETITVSKAFYNKASKYGTTEYRNLRKAIQENPTYDIVFKTIEKKTYGGLTFETMEAYIQTQAKSVERLAEFDAVKKIAEAKGGKYPLTKKWFLETYPAFKSSEVSCAETETLLNESKQIKSITERKAS